MRSSIIKIYQKGIKCDATVCVVLHGLCSDAYCNTRQRNDRLRFYQYFPLCYILGSGPPPPPPPPPKKNCQVLNIFTLCKLDASQCKDLVLYVYYCEPTLHANSNHKQHFYASEKFMQIHQNESLNNFNLCVLAFYEL